MKLLIEIVTYKKPKECDYSFSPHIAYAYDYSRYGTEGEPIRRMSQEEREIYINLSEQIAIYEDLSEKIKSFVDDYFLTLSNKSRSSSTDKSVL